jgi:hypothetical protein
LSLLGAVLLVLAALGASTLAVVALTRVLAAALGRRWR